MTESELWSALREMQGQEFLTAKGLPFTFIVKGNELFVSRKDKSITRATVEMAFERVVKMQKNGIRIDGPKKLGTFGASYLYPIFIDLGIICAPEGLIQPDTENLTEHCFGEEKDHFDRDSLSDRNYAPFDSCISSEAVYNKKQKTSEGAIYMPRGKKKVEGKTRKPYPTYEERIAAAEQTIERLTKLNEERAALIAKTEAKLEERKSALAKSQDALEKAKAKKERLVAAMNKPVKEPEPKLTPEERAERRKEALARAREAKKAEKEKYDALVAALAESGKTVDELLDELKK